MVQQTKANRQICQVRIRTKVKNKDERTEMDRGGGSSIK